MLPDIVQVKQKQEKLVKFTEYSFLQDNTSLFIRGWAFKNLEGRLLTLVESMGLGEKQEEAVKGYMRREVWTTVYESYEMSDEARDFITEDMVGSTKPKSNKRSR